MQNSFGEIIDRFYECVVNPLLFNFESKGGRACYNNHPYYYEDNYFEYIKTLDNAIMKNLQSEPVIRCVCNGKIFFITLAMMLNQDVDFIKENLEEMIKGNGKKII